MFSELQESGFAGVEPALPLGWTVPEDALDTLSEEDREEGVSALLTLTAIPSDGNASTSAEDIENGDVELAYKRFPVSESPSPNQNPEITSFLIDDTVHTEDDIVKVSAGGTYTIEAQLSEDSVEEYSYTTPDGINETRRKSRISFGIQRGDGFCNRFHSILSVQNGRHQTKIGLENSS